jgi:PEP-CTERM motif
MKTATLFAALVPAALLTPGLGVAALPTGTLAYLAPTGTAGPNDVIDVRVRFTLDAGSSDLTFSSNPLAGFAAADLPLRGTAGDQSQRDFASITSAYLNTSFYCTGTFTTNCDPSANYAFFFWLSSAPGAPSINFLDTFTLAAGASTDYLFGQFKPVAGGAAAGNYTFYNTDLFLTFVGADAAGETLRYDHKLAEACGSATADCAFTRTVTAAVPEPGTYALMLLGLAGLGAYSRKRSR